MKKIRQEGDAKLRKKGRKAPKIRRRSTMEDIQLWLEDKEKDLKMTESSKDQRSRDTEVS